MLTQIFTGVLLMSAVGGGFAIFLLCLKPITQKIFSPCWQYYIWLTVLVVMILPVHFSLPSRTAAVPVTSLNHSESIEAKASPTDGQPDDVQAFEQVEKTSAHKINLPQNLFCNLAKIWLLGAIAVFFTKIIKYTLFLKAINKNSVSADDIPGLPRRLTVKKTDMLDAPLLVGIFKPTLFLPNVNITKDDMNYILMHELTHYRRGDILYKWFAMTVSSVHWFNPFVHIVSRQIDTDCEVSCDFAVTGKMSDSEKNNYMNMILDLLSNSKSVLRPLTTQMASGKKTIKRRFAMIKNKKTTGKFVSAISFLFAAVIFSSAVFSSGALSDLITDDYTIDIFKSGEKIEFANKPFIENGEIYVPLRETLEKAMPQYEGIVDIQWDNGTIDVIVAYYQGESGKYQLKIGGKFVKLQHISYEDYKNNSVEKSMVITSLSLKQALILKNSTTYITLSDANYMLYGYTNRRDENNSLYKLSYNIYDKSGEMIAAESNPISTPLIKTSQYNDAAPEYVTYQFFYLFGNGDFESMKSYCTPSCVSTYFHDDGVFGMKKASLTEMKIDPLEHTKSSNGFNVFVTVDIVPSEASVFDKNITSTSFYVVFQRQENGKYLIDRFQTGI